MITTDFLLSGKAVFTVANPSEERYTFKVYKAEKLNLFFVSMLTGSNNNTDYTYIGRFSTEYKQLVITSKSKIIHNSKPFKVFNWAIKHIVTQKPVPDGYFIEHNGHCGRCGRVLTTPESIKSGLGPVCRGK